MEVRLVIAEEFYDVPIFSLVKAFKGSDPWLKRLQLAYLIVCQSYSPNNNYVKFNDVFVLKSEVERRTPWYPDTKQPCD